MSDRRPFETLLAALNGYPVSSEDGWAVLVKWTRMEHALTAIAEGNLGDLPWQADLARVSEFARAALETP